MPKHEVSGRHGHLSPNGGVAWRALNQVQHRQGHDAVHLVDRGAEQAQDPDVLRWARDEERVLLAHDLDFSELVAASQGELPSVIVFRLRNMTPDSVNQHLQRVLDRHRQPLEAGAIFSVREGRIRWRSIPFQKGD